MPYGLVNADVMQTSDGLSLGAGNATLMKNKLINGSMNISQRNGSSTVTPANQDYTLDRWQAELTQSSKFTVAQSGTAPTGFSTSLLVTSSSAYSVTSGDQFDIRQKVEGFNTYDLAWGSASAKTVTLSFWVQSSVTGTFGGAIANGAWNYSYPFNYTISAANTWEYKTVTIAGPTSGTWIGATNGVGLQVVFSLGTGSTYSGTANTWQSGLYNQPTGSASLLATNGATWYITGCQLERGSSATGFEYVNYQTSLANCQRYCLAQGGGTVAYGTATGTNQAYRMKLVQAVPLRASPTTSFSNMAVAVPGIPGSNLSSINTTYFQNGFVEYDVTSTGSYGSTLGQTAAIQGGGTFIVSSEL